MRLMVKFYSEKVSENVTRIHGIAGEYMYLAEGAERAALIDTGSGVGSLKEYVGKLTDKPYIILLTHGHLDHAMGASEFDTEIYMNPADHAVYKEHSDMKLRKRSLEGVAREVRDRIEESDYIPVREKKFLSLDTGDCFDLGGLTLETYACPGHTPGSVTFLIKEERTLLLGDACNPFTFLFLEYSLSVEAYKQVLEKLKKQTAGKYDRVYLSHGEGEGDKHMIDSAIQVCEDILNGNVDDVPFEFMGEQAYVAKAMTTGMRRLDGGIANIVYRKM